VTPGFFELPLELPLVELPMIELPIRELPLAKLPLAELLIAELPLAELPMDRPLTMLVPDLADLTFGIFFKI